tara:strand:- start:15252 stop:15818 length:567 start_codon:yes stop_codon:yes gene_type:complete
MLEIEKILKKIIPPDTRDEDFSNHKILDSLTLSELKRVEFELIKMLENNNDFLIGETLVYLKSKDSIQAMRKRIDKEVSSSAKIKWATLINELNNGDPEMERIAFEEFKRFEFIYEIEGIIFYDLIKFNSNRINKLIEGYINHKYFLVRHHSKYVLNYENYATEYDKSVKKLTTVNRGWIIKTKHNNL